MLRDLQSAGDERGGLHPPLPTGKGGGVKSEDRPVPQTHLDHRRDRHGPVPGQLFQLADPDDIGWTDPVGPDTLRTTSVPSVVCSAIREQEARHAATVTNAAAKPISGTPRAAKPAPTPIASNATGTPTHTAMTRRLAAEVKRCPRCSFDVTEYRPSCQPSGALPGSPLVGGFSPATRSSSSARMRPFMSVTNATTSRP